MLRMMSTLWARLPRGAGSARDRGSAYLRWIARYIRYIRYHDARRPSELGEPEIIGYLKYVADGVLLFGAGLRLME